MTPVTVSSATPDDVPAMAALLEEMDRFYGATGTEPEGERERGDEIARHLPAI